MTANPLTPIPPIGSTTAIGAPPPTGRFKPLDPVKILRQHARLLVVSAVVGVVLGVVLWAVLRQTSPKYQSQAQLFVTDVRTNIENIGQGDEMAQRLEPLVAFIRTQAFRIKSEDIIGDVIKRSEVRDTTWFKSFADAQRARESLQEELSASPVTGTQLLGLSMATSVPEDSRRILEAVIDVYLQKLSIETQIVTGDARRVLRQTVDGLDAEIRRYTGDMEEFTKRYDLPTLDVRSTEAKLEFDLIAEQSMKLRMAGDQLKQSLAAMQAQAKEGVVPEPTPEDMAFVEADPAIASRDEKLRQFRESRDAMLKKFGENHPAVVDLDRMAEAIEQERKREVQRLLRKAQEVKATKLAGDVQSVEAQVASLQPKLEEARARMTDLTNRLQEYKGLQRAMDIALERKQQAEDRLYSIQVSLSAGDARVRKHLNPSTPVLTFPKATVIIPGVTFLFVGAIVGLVFLIEMLDQRMKSPADIKMLANAELLGVLPDGGEDPSGSVPIESVVKHYPTGLMAESFRHVRTALLTRMDRRGYKTLVLVGARPGSGTSSIVGNLALSMAYNGRRVLVIDANFRRPNQHQLFDVPRSPGLVDVLQAGTPLDQVVRHVQDPELDVLPAGAAEDAPPELLEGPAFRRMLTGFESQYDMILIDAPPALLASDSQLLAKHVDALALIVRAMADKRGMVERMLRVLDGQRADVLGIVLNGVQSTAGGYLRQSYQEFYRYRSGATSKAAYGARSSRFTRSAPSVPAGSTAAGSGNGVTERTNGNGHGEIDATLDDGADDDLSHRPR